MIVIRGDADHDYTAMRHTLLVALVGTALLAGCGGDDDKTTAATKPASDAGVTTSTNTIKIVDFVYDPAIQAAITGQPA